MASVSVEPTEDTGHQGQQRHRGRDLAERVQDAWPASALRAYPAAQYRQERRFAEKLLEESEDRGTPGRDSRGDLRVYRGYGEQGDRGRAVSSNTHGPTKFIAPGSLNVKIEGKSVQLLGDQMLNNGGPSRGSDEFGDDARDGPAVVQPAGLNGKTQGNRL